MLVDPAHGWVLIGGSSSDAPSLRQLRSSDNFWWCLGWCYSVRPTNSRSGPRSTAPLARSARVNALRRSAASRQPGCSHAPRPGRVAAGSGTTVPASRTTRRRPSGEVRARQPMQVRMLVDRAALTSIPGRIQTDPASVAPRRRCSGRTHRNPSRERGISRLSLRGGRSLGGGLIRGVIGPDVDAPPGQAGRQPGVLPLAADGQ